MAWGHPPHPRGKNGAPPQSGRSRYAKPTPRPPIPRSSAYGIRCAAHPFRLEAIAGTDTPLRSESQAEAVGVSRPGRATRGWTGAVTIALRGDRSIGHRTGGTGVPPVHPHGGAKKDKSGRSGRNIAARSWTEQPQE